MWSTHRLWTYIVLCAVVLNIVLPLPAQAANGNVAQSHNTPFQSLYRADIRVATAYARAQLTKAKIPIISSQATQATVLVDMLQIAWLAADGYEPTHLLSIESMRGVVTPLVVQPRTVTTARALALHGMTTVSSLRVWATTMTPELTQSVITATAIDSDNDGLSDDEEAIWCLNPNNAYTNSTGVKDGVQVQRVRDWMANRRETNSGSIPYLANSINVGDCIDTDGDGVPNAVEMLLGLNPNRASSDFDKYNDAQELFGRTVGTNIDMPGYVKNPGRHPMVAAFPKPVISITDDSIHVDVVTTITANGNAVTTNARNYNSTHDTTVETQRTDDAVWAHWMQVDTSNRVRSARTAGVDEWTVYQKDTQTSDGGSGEENQLNWGDIVDCINLGSYDSSNDCSQLFVTYPDEPTNDSGDPCQFDASGCGSDAQWDTYVTQSDSYTAPTDAAPDKIGVGDMTTCTSGFDGNCVPDAFITEQNNLIDTGTTSNERPVEQSGDVIEQPNSGTTIDVTDVQPVENAQPDVPVTQPDTTDGNATSTDSTVEVVTFDEQAIDDPGQIITLQSLDNVTAINTAHAADLTFSYKIRNDGTDMMTELKNIKFNVYLNDDEYPITTYAVGNDKGSFANYKPGDASATLTISSNEKIPLTIDQLKAIEVDPNCVAEVRQGMHAANTPCPGGRVRITVADMSYGADQLFYDNAVASGVMLGIDDGNSDGSVGIDWYVLPTWELLQSDTIADVVRRYFPTTQDENGVLTGITVPKFGTTTPPKGCNNSSVVGSGANAVLWCPFDLSRTQWMEVLTNGIAVSQDIATAPASAGAKVILRLQRDSDGDGYSDDTELEYGTNPNSASQRPAPHLAAGVATRVVNGVTQGTLSIENSGNYPAQGIKATIFSPTTSNAVRNNQVGGSGEIDANSQLIIGSESQINQAASDWTGTAQLLIAGYYSGVQDVRYTLTAVCSDTCAIGSGDTTMTWSDSNGGSGTLAVGADYASPTDIAIGDDGLTVGFQTGSVVNGETLIVDATAPADTFQWVNSDSATSKPVVLVEYGDATGAHRFALPAASYLTDVTDPLTALHGAMLRAPTIDMVSHDFTADVGGQISLLLDNPLTTTIESSQVLVRIMDADGKTQWQAVRSLSDIATGPMVVESIPWATSGFADPYDATKTYTMLALWGDYQGNVIDSQARLLSDFQNDRLPELSVTLEGSTATTVTRGSANITINFGNVAQGYPMKRLFTLGNVGDVPLRAVVDKIPFGQTSFAGSFFVPPGLTMPYMVAIDSGQLSVGAYQQTITLRTSDAQWSALTITLNATITASPVGGALAYIIDPYKPLTTGLYVQGPQSRKAVVKYTEAAAVDAVKVHPLVVRDDLSDQTLGLGRKIASNPSAYGYDPALVGLGMQGAVVEVQQGGINTSTQANTPVVNPTSTPVNRQSGWLVVTTDKTTLNINETLGITFTLTNKYDDAAYRTGTVTQAISIQGPISSEYAFLGDTNYTFDQHNCWAFQTGSPPVTKFPKQTGYFHVTAGYAGWDQNYSNSALTCPVASTVDQPWRWSIGSTALAAGATRVINGSVKFTKPGTYTLFFGLNKDNVGYPDVQVCNASSDPKINVCGIDSTVITVVDESTTTPTVTNTPTPIDTPIFTSTPHLYYPYPTAVGRTPAQPAPTDTPRATLTNSRTPSITRTTTMTLTPTKTRTSTRTSISGEYPYPNPITTSPTRTSTRTPTLTRTPTASRTATQSRTITPSPTLTPTPNDSFAVDKADTGPERERRILIPTAFAKSARYAIDNGLLYTYTAANSTQSASIRLPRSEYLTMTLELWPLTALTGKIDVDVGGNGTIDWTLTNASPGRIASKNLASAVTAYMAGKTTDTVDVPITIKSAAVGQLLLVNVVGVPLPQADLNAASMSVAGARSNTTNGFAQVQVPRAATNRVSVTIKNDGKGVAAASSAALAADLPGQGLWYIDSQPVPRLAAGASATITFSWDTARWPNLTGQLKLIIDPYAVLPERAKGNNTRSLSFRIANGVIAPTETPSPTFTKTLTPSKTRTITRTPTNTKTPTSTKTNTPTVTLTVPPTMIAAPVLRLRYRFDEADTATSYADSSGNNNSLDCYAPDTTCPHTQQFAINNDMGGALYFSRSDATLARATAPVPLASAFSLSAWIRLADVGHTQVFMSHGASATNKSVVLGVNATNQAFCTVGAVTVTSTTAFNFASHLLTCVYDLNSGTLVLYYDRDVVATTNSVLPYLNNNTNTLSLGARWLGNTSASDYFDGWLDEVSIWNSALSPREVELLYNQPRDNGNRMATRTATVTITRTATASPTKKK